MQFANSAFSRGNFSANVSLNLELSFKTSFPLSREGVVLTNLISVKRVRVDTRLVISIFFDPPFVPVMGVGDAVGSGEIGLVDRECESHDDDLEWENSDLAI